MHEPSRKRKVKQNCSHFHITFSCHFTMILSQVTLVCLATLVLGQKYNSDSTLNNCGDECPETCLCACNVNTGECTEGCVDGYYGHNCNKTCDRRCRKSVCVQHDGQCACELGYLYSNSRCEKDAGKQCQKNKVGCLDDRCSSTGDEECMEGCKPGLFGTSCESPCGDNCFCDQESGKCTDCVPGWFGPECQSQCSSGCTEGCYKNGSCIDGCKPGSYGEQCDILCSRHCVSGCDQLSGECVQCEAGRYGPTCQSECSAGCVGCDREGSCIKGCVKGYYGETCVSICPQQCNDGLCDLNGSCNRGCVKGYYGEKCESTCPQQCNYDLCNLNGTCVICKIGFYGPACSVRCEGCLFGDCDKATGYCKRAEDGTDLMPYIIGGGVLLIVVVLAVCMVCCLKRIDGRIYFSARWKRHPSALGDDLRAVASPRLDLDHSDIDEEQANTSLRNSLTTYVEPFHTVGIPVVPQQQAVSDSDQQVAAASPENLQPSDGLLNQAAALTYMGDASRRPDSYVLPNYCDMNKELIATPHQLQRRQETAGLVQSLSPILSDTVSAQSDDGNLGDINIPLIAECSWNSETEDSSPDNHSIPDDENYNHPFRDHYY